MTQRRDRETETPRKLLLRHADAPANKSHVDRIRTVAPAPRRMAFDASQGIGQSCCAFFLCHGEREISFSRGANPLDQKLIQWISFFRRRAF
jgi:hypothetical protein